MRCLIPSWFVWTAIVLFSPFTRTFGSGSAAASSLSSTASSNIDYTYQSGTAPFSTAVYSSTGNELPSNISVSPSSSASASSSSSSSSSTSESLLSSTSSYSDSASNGEASTGDASSNSSAVSSSTGIDSSQLVAQNVTAALQVTFLSSYPYSLYSSDPDRFVANFKQDLYRSCDIPVNRVVQVMVVQLPMTQSMARSLYLSARISKAATVNTMSISFLLWPAASSTEDSSEYLFAVLQQQVNTTNSLLYQGAVTSYVTSSSSKMVGACSDGTYQSPCSSNGSPVQTSINTTSSSTLPTWIIAVIAVIVALIVLAAIVGIMTRTQSRKKDSPPSLKKEPSMSSSSKRRQLATTTQVDHAGFLGVPHTAPLVVSAHSAESAADILQSNNATAIEDVDLTNVVGLTRSSKPSIRTVDEAGAVAAAVQQQPQPSDEALEKPKGVEAPADLAAADHESTVLSNSELIAVKIHL